MTKIGNLLKRFEDEAAPFTPEEVVSAWNSRLADLGLDNVTVDSADIDIDGKVKLTLSSNGDFMEVGFFVKDEDGERIPYAVTMGDEDGQGSMELDLSNANVPVIDGGTGTFIDMTSLDWLTDEVANSILGAEAVVQSEPEIEPEEIPVGGEEEEGPEDDEEPYDGEMPNDDEDPENQERYVGFKKVEGKLRAEWVRKPCEHKVLARRARAAFRNTFEAMSGRPAKRESKRRASVKARRR